MDYLIEINKDCFGVCGRLKTIDPSYKVFFNLKRNCFEVHSFLQARNSYCFSIPFDQLDERTLDYAIKTRSENRDKIIEEIDKYNKRVEAQNLKMQVDALKELICR